MEVHWCSCRDLSVVVAMMEAEAKGAGMLKLGKFHPCMACGMAEGFMTVPLGPDGHLQIEKDYGPDYMDMVQRHWVNRNGPDKVDGWYLVVCETCQTARHGVCETAAAAAVAEPDEDLDSEEALLALAIEASLLPEDEDLDLEEALRLSLQHTSGGCIS